MKLDGREFSGIDHAITAAQNDFIIGHLRAAGALEVLAGLDLKQSKEATIDKAREDVVTKIFLSGRKSFVLAGLLTEVGKTWTRAEADRNAAIFDQTTNGEDLEVMTALVVRAVIDFFRFAGTSSPSSPKSLNPNDEALDTKSADPGTSGSSVQ
jgi:hypothetical protein